MVGRTAKLDGADRHEAAGSIAVRLLEDADELTETEAIQREVWGVEDLDIVPAAQLRAVAHAGGHVSGAFIGDDMVGFAYGFVATPHGKGMAGTGLHSHMVAVRPRGRGRGVGLHLKWFQRSWCLERGMEWITWTFDPLQARNAKLNLRHLGAVSHEYLVDFYGPMPGTLGGGQASDRLLALWLLNSERVASRARRFAGDQETAVDGGVEATPVSEGAADVHVATFSGESGAWLLRPEDISRPVANHWEAAAEAAGRGARAVLRNAGSSAPERRAVKVAVPADLTGLLQRDPEMARAWRLAVRAAMTEALGAGMMVVDFENGAYMLQAATDNQGAVYRM